MRLPWEVTEAITSLFGEEPRTVTPLSGGQVGSSFRLGFAEWPLFLKWKEGAPARFFKMEADGLGRLRRCGPLRVPEVVAAVDAPEAPLPFILLEWIEPARPDDEIAFARRLGEGLAEMHLQGVSPTGAFGLAKDNFLGSQPQKNVWEESWPVFYRDLRLAPQIERAKREGRLTVDREVRLRRLMERVEEILKDHEPHPSLIHGDLWAGNLLSAGDEPVLIDPAVYYADREVEIAYMQLFSGFSAATFEAYSTAFPLESGYLSRRPLHQLYPLLIHLNHFGVSAYWPGIEEVLRIYGV